MAELTCADGSRLGVHPVPVLDRDGVAYEVTLRLTRDGEAFGEVGERCGYFLAATAARLRAARRDDPEGFPDSSAEAGVRSWALDVSVDADRAWAGLERYLPRDRVLFAFRSREPDDLSTTGELRVNLEDLRAWRGATADGPGRWSLTRRAVLEAWGAHGVGVRCVLTSAELLGWLEALVQEFADAGARYDGSDDGAVLRRPVG